VTPTDARARRPIGYHPPLREVAPDVWAARTTAGWVVTAKGMTDGALL
jgi:hypothetical protein